MFMPSTLFPKDFTKLNSVFFYSNMYFYTTSKVESFHFFIWSTKTYPKGRALVINQSNLGRVVSRMKIIQYRRTRANSEGWSPKGKKQLTSYVLYYNTLITNTLYNTIYISSITQSHSFYYSSHIRKHPASIYI